MNLGLDTKSEASQLATMMLQWEELQLLAEQLRTKIEVKVMQIGKTLTVGTVRAMYSGGRKVYDYLYAAGSHPDISEDVMQAFTITPPPRTDWRKVCEHLCLSKDYIPFTQTEPSVTVKLLPE